MTVQIAYPHLEEPPGQSPRLQRLPRVRVAQVAMDYLAHGWSAEEIARQHPNLSLAEIHAALMYYFDHQQSMDQEIRQEWARARSQRQASILSPFADRMQLGGQ